MPISEAPFAPGTVLRVPFPYTGAETRQHRPALVVAEAGAGSEPFLLWVVMITSAENRGWPADVDIADSEAAGLPVASVVRTAKIATIDHARAEARGRIDAGDLLSVRAAIAARLDMMPQDRSG